MSLAADTRAAVRARPFLYDALRAGVVNYTAAARFLAIGDEAAVAAALRRFADDLPDLSFPGGDARVSMRSGLTRTDDPAAAILVVGDLTLTAGDGDLTAIQAVGDVGPHTVGRALRRLATEDIPVIATGATDGTVLVVVDRRTGPDALRHLESTLAVVA